MLGMADHHEYRDALTTGPARGRGSGLNPGNRFESTRLHVLGEHLDEVLAEQSEDALGRQVTTHVYADRSKTIINSVDSPDIGFNWSLNAYRGCEHGCIYCYARPYHELLGFSCGLDFETKIVAKMEAAAMLRRELAKPKWQGEVIAMSGVTDCYQPVEAKLGITRGCLEVMAQCRQPVGIVTKNRLVARDLDLLMELSRYDAVHVAVSVTSLDPKLAAKMEPRASSPSDRLETIRRLREAGVGVSAMIAPIIPGINDREIPQLIEAVADAGAASANYTLLRLPHQVKDLFLEWLARYFPERAGHVESLIRDSREGELNQSEFGKRMRGTGQFARQIRNLFMVLRRKHGLPRPGRGLSGAHFRRPMVDGQMSLF